MNKEEIINYLITHEYSEWQEEDRDWLMSLDENKLKKMQSLVENLESCFRNPKRRIVILWKNSWPRHLRT